MDDRILLKWLSGRKATRRGVLEAMGKGVAVAATVGAQIVVNDRVKTAELNRNTENITSGIGWLRGQEERLKKGETDSLCLVFGGATVQSAERLAIPIAPELGNLGAVGYIDYAYNDPDISGLAGKIREYERKYPQVKKMTIYGSSLGTHIAAGVIQELEKQGSNLKLEYLIMDSTPPDISYTDYPWAELLVKPLDAIGGDAIVTGYTNYEVYGNPREPGAASPDLHARQGAILRDGIHYLNILSDVVVRHKTKKVAFLTPEDPEKDGAIDAERSEKRLKQNDLFPKMETFKVGGVRQGHANPDHNGYGYRRTLRFMLQSWGFAV